MLLQTMQRQHAETMQALEHFKDMITTMMAVVVRIESKVELPKEEKEQVRQLKNHLSLVRKP